MLAVHHEAFVEVILLTCCIHEGGEYSLRHDLSKGHRRVVLRDGVLVVHACQDFVCAEEDFLGEFTSFSIEGDIVVFLDQLVVDSGWQRLGDGVLVGGGGRGRHWCRCWCGAWCGCQNAGLVLHLDDLVEDNPRCLHGVRVLGAKLVLGTPYVDPCCQFLGHP